MPLPRPLLALGLLLLVLPAALPQALAQPVAVYVSMRNLTYAPPLEPVLADFVQEDDTLALQQAALKRAVSIRLGHVLTQTLRESGLAKQAFFINAEVDLAKAFIPALGPEGLDADALRSLWPGTPPRTVLAVRALDLQLERRPGVVAVSKRLHTVWREVPLGRLTLAAYNGQTGQLIGVTETQAEFANPKGEVDPGPATEQLLANMLRQALADLGLASQP